MATLTYSEYTDTSSEVYALRHEGDYDTEMDADTAYDDTITAFETERGEAIDAVDTEYNVVKYLVKYIKEHLPNGKWRVLVLFALFIILP